MLRLLPVKKLSTQSTSSPGAQQALAQVGAEEAGAAGDEDAALGVVDTHSKDSLFFFDPGPRRTQFREGCGLRIGNLCACRGWP